MLKKLMLIILLSGALAAPVYADDLGPTQSGSSVNGSTDMLNALQPANPSLQSTSGLSGSDNSNGTGISALQPAGSKSDAASLLVGSVDGQPQTPVVVAKHNFANDLLLGVAGIAFLMTGAIIYRTSKRLETMQPSETDALIPEPLTEAATEEPVEPTQEPIEEEVKADNKKDLQPTKAKKKSKSKKKSAR